MWLEVDTSGDLDSGPSCDECGACDCLDIYEIGGHTNEWCIGLSHYFLCMEGGESPPCYGKEEDE